MSSPLVDEGYANGDRGDKMMMDQRIPISEDLLRPQMMTLREFRPFKTSDEYLWAMKEDLSDWLNILYPELSITPHKFMECLETGVTLCKHANNVRRACVEWLNAGRKLPKCWGRNEWKLPTGDVTFKSNARPETFFARDNVHNFITWCRNLGIFECLLFESDDLILRKNEKNVILCLLEVARRGSHFGMATPLLVQFEKEIDRDIAKDTGADLSSSGEEEESFQEYGPMPQIITNDLRSLDEMVRELVERCTCPTQFPMIRVAEGKYRIGNTKVMIYVRILRNHVMVRVGGGWDTLAHYLDKHDPCRCSSGHRATTSSRLIMKGDGVSAPRMKVEYERRELSFDPVVHSTPAYSVNSKKPADLSDSSSEISDEGYKTADNTKFLGTSNSSSPTTNINANGNNNNNKEFLKGQQSRRSSMSRTRSLSKDEHDRPDSRSTDEEVAQIPVGRERSGSKGSSNNNRAASGHPHFTRSLSCERRPHQDLSFRVARPNTNSNERSSANKNNAASNSNHRLNIQNAKSAKPQNPRTLPPRRSLSASGSADFYGAQSLHLRHQQHPPITRLNKSPTSLNCNSVSATRLVPHNSSQYGRSTASNASGKNTWNGNTKRSASSSRIRPNLFQANYFNNSNNNIESEQTQMQNDDQQSPNTDDAGDQSLNLAEWIKKALELDSDAAKISHIEMAIKQFEERGPCQNVPDFEAASLPYNIYDSELPSHDMSICSTISNGGGANNIRKRKENGVTRIPKPNFF